MSEITVGIIGCGLMGSHHARVLNQMPGVRVAAVHNRTRGKAELLAAEVGAQVFDSYEQLLEQPLDAVWVATPDHLHVEQSKAVLEAGKHLFLEKVIATSPEDGAEIVAAGARHPELKTMIGYPLRFDPAFRRMKKLLSQANAGTVIQANMMRSHFLDAGKQVYDKYRQHYYDTPDWYFRGSDKSGSIYSHASHDYDLLHWLCGDIESVFAYGGSYLNPAVDAFTLSLRFKSGGVAQVSTPWVTRVESDTCLVATERFTVLNQDGELRYKDDDGPEERLRFAENDMWTKLNGHFIACIRENKQPEVSLEDGLRAIAVSEAALRSLKERREVEVLYPSSPVGRQGKGGSLD